MTFLWPSMLITLLAVPLIVWLYLRVQQRRRAAAASFAQSGIREEQRSRPGIRRHVPPLIFLAGLLLLLVSLARPQAEISLPRLEGTVILVFDVSGSMAAADAQPTRLEAAKQTAIGYVQSLPETVQIGIVTFSGNGFTVQSPTNDQNMLLTTINRLKPQTGTSLGQGILVAMNTIAVDAGFEPLALPTPDAANLTPGSDQSGPMSEAMLAQLPEGPYPPSVIVLLSDGENNQSIDPQAAAQAAAERSVRIDAIGFGTPVGTVIDIDGFSVHTALDETALRSITGAAGGAYYNAQNMEDPQEIYKNLTPQMVVKPENMEITSVFSAVSLSLMLLGALFSTIWFKRLP